MHLASLSQLPHLQHSRNSYGSTYMASR
ncbi:hypothetical protein PSPO01_00839 [Paraphaeosphaeria sporulosa]